MVYVTAEVLGKKRSPNKHPMYKLHSAGDKILYWSHVFQTLWFLPEPECYIWYTTLFMMVLANLTSAWYISLLYCVGASLFFPSKELKLYCCLIAHYSTTVLITGPHLSSLPAISSPVPYLGWNNFYLLQSHLLDRCTISTLNLSERLRAQKATGKPTTTQADIAPDRLYSSILYSLST